MKEHEIKQIEIDCNPHRVERNKSNDGGTRERTYVDGKRRAAEAGQGLKMREREIDWIALTQDDER